MAHLTVADRRAGSPGVLLDPWSEPGFNLGDIVVARALIVIHCHLLTSQAAFVCAKCIECDLICTSSRLYTLVCCVCALSYPGRWAAPLYTYWPFSVSQDTGQRTSKMGTRMRDQKQREYND
jgi:hypothetical protein